MKNNTAFRLQLPTQEQKLAFLKTASGRAGPRPHIEVIETHFAWLFLNRRYVYKLRKPLRHGGMDYRTLAQRQRGCRAEVALNRRMAPRAYLGVVPLTVSRSGRLRLGPGAQVVDYLVRMRRLPAKYMLDAVLRRRQARTAENAALLALLGGFFQSARRRPLSAGAYLSRQRRQRAASCRSLFAHTSEYRTLVERVKELQHGALKALRHELAARGAHLVDGHGDLRPEHICLKPPIAIIDCIEFDPELRRMDPLEEMAFLALEIERLGHAREAWTLLQRYRDTYDPAASDCLLHFYMSCRALTRARLSAWHIGDPQFPDPRPWQRRTRSYLRNAERHAAIALRLGTASRIQMRGGQPASSGVNGRRVAMRRTASPSSGATGSRSSRDSRSA